MNTEPLKELGLSENEIKVYLSCLKAGVATVSSIAEMANLPRTTTYDLLKSLKEKGYASYVIKSGVKYFNVVDPSAIIDKIKEKEESFKAILPDLRELQKMTIKKPKVEFYEGIEGLKTVSNDLIKGEHKEIKSYVSEETLKFMPIFHENFRIKRKERKIISKMLSNKSNFMENIKSRDKKELRETRFNEKIMKNSDVSSFIYGNKISFIISSKKEQIGIVIEDKNIADFYNKIFNCIWGMSL